MATLLVGGLLAFSAVSAKAGTIFTDQALFNAAVSGLTLAGTENFDALPTGPVASGAAFMVARSSYRQATRLSLPLQSWRRHRTNGGPGLQRQRFR